MVDANTWEGVQSLLDNYVRVQPDDKVVLLYTSDSYESAAWVSAALELRQISVKRVWMAPLRDDGFIDRLTAAIPAPAELSGRLIVLSFERDTMSHTRALAASLSKFDKTRHAVFRAISASSRLFSETLRVLPAELSARNTAILERCMNARRLQIKTPGGSDLVVAIDPRHRWISNRGTARPGGIVILPPGEVATFPASIEGLFVADFAFNVNAITDRDARLHNHPVSVWIEGGRAVRYECADPVTRGFLEECFYTSCAYNVGELGFGTNPGVVEAVPMNSHINERCPGVHVGFGQHNQDADVVGYQCAIHLDMVAKGGMVWIDDDPVPVNLEAITPSRLVHPMGPHDEDVFSPEVEDMRVDDCCGVFTSDGFQLLAPSQNS